MLKPVEKRLILIHVLLFVICAICKMYCQMHLDEWKYNFQMGALYWPTIIFAKPLFYYALGFLGAFFLARKAFRDDLQLPYKLLFIVSLVVFVLYIIAAGISLYLVRFGTTFAFLARLYSYVITAILDYYSLVCIPGILFGLVAEKRWKVQ